MSICIRNSGAAVNSTKFSCDKGRCVTVGRGHLDLRHSPQPPMNTGFLGYSKPRRGAGFIYYPPLKTAFSRPRGFFA